MSAPELAAGQIVGGKFTIRHERSRTELTASYEAITAPSRGVELKVLDPAVRQRADLDACLGGTMRATNELPASLALHILDVGIDNVTGAPFIATELSATPSLAELVQLCPLAVGELVSLSRNLATALDAAHSRGLAHLTLSPDNVFVGPAPRFEVRLADFGTTLLMGVESIDARWAAPELRVTPHVGCDVFSAGLIVLFAAAGVTLRDRSEAALRAPATTLAQETGTSLDARLDAPLARALAIDPAQRYRTVGELADAIAQAFGGAPTDTVLSSGAPPMAAPPMAAPPAVEAPLETAPPMAAPPVVEAPLETAPPMVALPSEARLILSFPPDAAVAPDAAGLVAAEAVPLPVELTFDPPQPGPIFVGSTDATDVTSGASFAPPRQRRALILVGVGLAVVVVAAVGVAVVALSRRTDASILAASASSERASSRPPSASASPAPAASAIEVPPSPASAAPAALAAATPVDEPKRTAQLTVSCTPECETITVDGDAVTAFPAELAPGEHEVTGHRGQHPPKTTRVTLVSGKQETVSFVFFATRPPRKKKPCGKFLQRCD